MKLIIRTMVLLLTLNACAVPVKNAKTVTAHVWGNCGMCQKKIEKAAYKKGEAKADWNIDTKVATITFDSTKTNVDEVLKRIAYVGYDNEKFLAPDDAYAALDGCCQYERKKKKGDAPTATAVAEKATAAVVYTCPMHPEVQSDKPGTCPKCGMALVKKQVAQTATASQETVKATTEEAKPAAHPLADVYAAYFALKDALTKDDAAGGAGGARALFKAIDKVEMGKLKADEHSAWMKYYEQLSYDAEHIKGTGELEHQREHFASLSKNMYQLMKVAKPDYAVYFDFCPMYNEGKGANWLSKAASIKNPFYGSQMLSCGSVKETIK